MISNPEVRTTIGRPDLLEIAGWVRDAAEAYYPDNPTLDGQCHIVSTALVLVLKRFRYRARVVFGYYWVQVCDGNHYWCVAGSKIIDLTATQFGGPRILVTGRDDMRYVLHRDKGMIRVENRIYSGELRRGMNGLLADAFTIADITMDCIAEVSR